MYRAGTGGPASIGDACGGLLGHQAISFDRFQPLEEFACEHQPPLAGLVCHRATRSGKLFACPAPKIANIRFQYALHELAVPESWSGY